MEKLEKHIKEKLGERKITPSPKSWDKIASQVAIDENPGRRKWFPYAIAASFIGILIVSMLFFISKSPDKDPIQVVEENKSKKTGVQSKEEILEIKTKEQEQLEVVEINAKKEVHQREMKQERTLESTSEQELVEHVVKQPINDDFLPESDPLIAQKINEIVEQVAILESTNTEVTEAEVDALLRTAQREILTEKLFASDGTVDAMALLAEAEDELNESFREQIFDALKDGYSKLRTAVAERNN